MLSLWDHALFLVLAIGVPLFGFLYVHLPLERAALADVPRFRARTYRHILVMEWTLVAAVVLLWLTRGRDWRALGLTIGSGWIPALGWGVALAVGIFLVAQGRVVLGRPEYLPRLRRQVENIWRVLPATRGELRTFFVVSLTAGSCEELLYRGYLIGYLTHWMPGPAAALVTSVIFGVGHAYQGPRGMFTSGLLGLAFAGLYLSTGTLLPAMALHAVLDANSGWMVYQLARRHGGDWMWASEEQSAPAPSTEPLSGIAPETAPRAAEPEGSN